MIRIDLRQQSFDLRRLGLLGTLLAGATVALAAVVAGTLLFGRTLLLSASVWWLWPKVFSTEFTRWVFGADVVSFWKVLLLLAIVDAVRSAARRRQV